MTTDEHKPQPDDLDDASAPSAAQPVAGALDDLDEYLDDAADDLGSAETAPLDFDIDAALAAVGSLDSVMNAESAREQAERERLEAEQRAEDEYQRWAESYQFPRPGMTRVQAGRPASLIPAVALIALGGLVTFGGTLNLPLTPEVLWALAGAALGLAALTYWLASRRWARGASFVGWAAIGLAAVSAAPTLIGQPLPSILPLGVIGLACALTGLLSRPNSAGLGVIGLGVAAASVVVWLIA